MRGFEDSGPSYLLVILLSGRSVHLYVIIFKLRRDVQSSPDLTWLSTGVENTAGSTVLARENHKKSKS